jgi:hypothetical protein
MGLAYRLENVPQEEALESFRALMLTLDFEKMPLLGVAIQLRCSGGEAA